MQVISAGAQRGCKTGRADMDVRSSHNPNQDGEFMAVRLTPKQAVGAVGAGAMRESGRVYPNIRVYFFE